MCRIKQWYYRGSLKSCNYRCSYCPFSKKKSSLKKLEDDRQQLFRFVERMNGQESLGGAVQIVPYGEALIHKYYWEGLARLSRNERIEAVGAQSNFSFPADEMLEFYQSQGGDITKLRLWGTFHPEMVSLENFISQCNCLSRWQISYCVGAVGVPEQICKIRKLRECLDSNIYLWINKMDGLGRNYTEKEAADFLSIDEYFGMEQKHHPADVQRCRHSIFVEADGTLRRCCISRQSIGNFYGEAGQSFLKEYSAESAAVSGKQVCLRKECGCFLAYNNRNEEELLFFRPFPAFRIPVYPKAIFLDLDGTLLPKGAKTISEETARRIEALSGHCSVYLATSRPLEDALNKVRGISGVLKGGVFAYGARCVVWEREEHSPCKNAIYDHAYPVETIWLDTAQSVKKKYGFRIHVYRKEEIVYKVTLAFPGGRRCMSESSLASQLVAELKLPACCKWTAEGNCIQIISAGRGKLEGILELSKVMGYQKEDIMVVGNSDQDVPMLAYFPLSVAVKGSSKRVEEAAKISLSDL